MAAGDPGTVVDGDGNAKSTVTKYNSQSNTQQNYRYGFVAITKDGKSHYGEMHTGKKGTATYEVPANTERLYSVYWLLLISIIVMPGMMMRPMMSNGLIV